MQMQTYSAFFSNLTDLLGAVGPIHDGYQLYRKLTYLFAFVSER